MYDVNRLPKRNVAESPTGCCPEFNPDEWDGETFRFKDKLFMKVITHSFLHIPLGMNSVMKEAMARIEEAGARSSDEYIMLSHDVSPWKCEHYISVDKEVPDTEMERLSGTYLARVFEGPFKNAGAWYEQLIKFVESRGATLVKVYFSYTTCPRCAKFYGKNYVVGFAQIDPGSLSGQPPEQP